MTQNQGIALVIGLQVKNLSGGSELVRLTLFFDRSVLAFCEIFGTYRGLSVLTLGTQLLTGCCRRQYK